MATTTNESGPTAEEARAEGPGDEVRALTKERDDFLDQLQRSRAEFNNYQKRSKAQAEADRQYAVASLAVDLLPVIDNFERAAEAARSAGAPAIVEGLDMVHKQLLAALLKHEIEPIQAVGKPFDPNFHEALMQRPDAGHPEGTVVAELGKGYRLRDRVLRPTKVAVSIAAG